MIQKQLGQHTLRLSRPHRELSDGARYATAAAVLCLVLGISGCAASTQLQTNGAHELTDIYVHGGNITKWPAHLIKPTPPEFSETLPFSKDLWSSGHKVAGLHCYFLDKSGKPRRVTLLGVLTSINHGITTPQIGRVTRRTSAQPEQKISERVLENYKLADNHFQDAIWHMSGGSRQKIEVLLKDAVEHDAYCLSLLRHDFVTRQKLLRQNMVPARDLQGNQVLALLNPSDPIIEPSQKFLKRSLQHHHENTQAIIGLYKLISEDLAQKLDGSTRTVARQPTPAHEVQRVVTHEPVPLSKGAPKPTRPKRGNSLQPIPNRVALSLVPLQKEAAETLADLQKARELCLNKASRECT